MGFAIGRAATRGPVLNRVRYFGTDYQVEPGETILRALLRQGANARYSCGKGSCRACMVRMTEGEVTYSTPLPVALEQSGHVLPCICMPAGDLVLEAPDLSAINLDAEIVELRRLREDVLEVGIAPLSTFAFAPGQHIDLIRSEDGLARAYSIASLPEDDFFFRIHVRRVDGGQMSGWLFDQARVGLKLAIRGSFGDCCYQESMRDRPLLILATGVGGGAMLALARQALYAGHKLPIRFYHGVRHEADRYLDSELEALARQYPNFHSMVCISRPSVLGQSSKRVVEAAFGGDSIAAGCELFLCGNPSMVEQARVAAVAAGVGRECLHADPFTHQQPEKPRDREKIAAFQPDPELWAALDEGRMLKHILAEFYTEVFADARLSPFFEGFTPEYVASKQFSFLRDLLTGQRHFFGMNPYNSHHWMVISDELFDYREAMFERVMRRHLASEKMLHRFMAIHELFRAEIVKAAPRGMIFAGAEQAVKTHSVEVLDIDTVCDKCGREIPAGRPARYHHRIGALHCSACAGIVQAAEREEPNRRQPDIA